MQFSLSAKLLIQTVFFTKGMKTDSAFNWLLTPRNRFTFGAWGGLTLANRSHQTSGNRIKHIRAGVGCLTRQIRHNAYFNKFHNTRINKIDYTELHGWVTSPTPS
jgi:hypothetical protein